MIEVFLYSIAGKKTDQTIDDLVQEFAASEYVPRQEKKILRHTQEVAKNGNYPTSDYYGTFYPKPEMLYKSRAEIKTYCKAALDFYKKQDLEKKLITAINDSNNSSELLNRLNALADSNQGSDDFDLEDIRPRLYGDNKDREVVKGVLTGIKELDDVTFGFQPGSVASVCAFTGHGKSTLVESVVFKNALESKKNIFVSLEMSPEIIWAQLEARYMNQVKGLQVSAQDLQFRKIPSDIEEKVLLYEEDFNREIADNIVIIDESYISKQMMLNYKMFSALVRKIASKLGGLDLIVFDHVGQFELMFPDCGNQIIKSIQSFSKTFVDVNGIKPVSIMAVQTNRQGEARARKRGGVYDIQAISDLNEVERTSTYIVFMYTSDDMKIMQETKVTLAKHRLGAVIPEPIVTTFNPSIITVGAAVENVSMSDDDFNDMELDLGTGGFDEF